MFRRRRAGVLLALLLVVLGIVLVPQIIGAAVAAGVRGDLERLAATADAALEVGPPASGDAASALASAVDAATVDGLTDAETSATLASLTAAVADYRDAVVDGGMDVLGSWSDAERSTEDALFAELSALRASEDADLLAALTAVAEASTAVQASAQAYRDEIAASATTAQPTGGDVDAQLAYLLAHADPETYNTEVWGDYNSAGGDCVNFTSQGLLARGWAMDDTWYSGGPWAASQTWRATSFMETYLVAQGFRASTIDDLDRVRVGDVGIFDWGDTGEGVDHAMTVSRVEYTADGPVISFASHNNDGQYRPMPATLTEPGSGSTMRIYSIP